MTNKWYSLQHMCTGVDTLEPSYRFEGNRMIWSHQLDKNQHRMGMFCESQNQTMYADPRHKNENDKKNITKLQINLNELENFDTYLLEREIVQAWGRIDKTSIPNHFYMGMHTDSVMT